MNTLQAKSNRNYSIDWLRVLAMGAVFILHCSHFFDHIGWHVKDKTAYEGFTLVLYFIHQWTMPTFFLLAGAAAWFSLGSRTTKQYVSARLKRLMIPYVFGVLVLIPPQRFLEAVNQRGFKGNYFEFLGGYFSPDNLWIDASLRFFGHYGTHLWFLGFLTVFSLAALPLFKMLRTEQARRRIDKWGEFFSRPGRIFLLFIPVAVAQITLRPLFPDYLHWADVVYWVIFLFYGYVIFSSQRLQEALMRQRNIALGIALSSFTIMTVWFFQWPEMLMRLGMSPRFTAMDAVNQTLCSINTWAWVATFLGMGKKYLNKKSKVLECANEAVLPFYILHQTVILIVGFFVIQWSLPVLVKFAVIMAISFSITLGLYEIIKRVRALRFLFGLRPSARGSV